MRDDIRNYRFVFINTRDLLDLTNCWLLICKYRHSSCTRHWGLYVTSQIANKPQNTQSKLHKPYVETSNYFVVTYYTEYTALLKKRVRFVI